MFTKRNDPHLKKSPLKSRPLRLPGQSVDEEIQRIFDEELVPELAASVFIALFAAWNGSVGISDYHPTPSVSLRAPSWWLASRPCASRGGGESPVTHTRP